MTGVRADSSGQPAAMTALRQPSTTSRLEAVTSPWIQTEGPCHVAASAASHTSVAASTSISASRAEIASLPRCRRSSATRRERSCDYRVPDRLRDRPCRGRRASPPDRSQTGRDPRRAPPPRACRRATRTRTMASRTRVQGRLVPQAEGWEGGDAARGSAASGAPCRPAGRTRLHLVGAPTGPLPDGRSRCPTRRDPPPQREDVPNGGTELRPTRTPAPA
jgi:hypothetical protein